MSSLASCSASCDLAPTLSAGEGETSVAVLPLDALPSVPLLVLTTAIAMPAIIATSPTTTPEPRTTRVFTRYATSTNRSRNASTTPSTGTRTCAMLSRSRIVTAWSSSTVWKSTVTHSGVPISS